MKQQGSGWKGESRRHSLARKGIKTNTMSADGIIFESSGISKITIAQLENMIRENNKKYGTNFTIGSTYGYYELWADGDRLEVGSKKDIYEAFIKYRFSEKYRKDTSKAILTNEEEKAWNFAFEYHINEGKSDKQADELAWNNLQKEFPRLKQFKGIASGISNKLKNKLKIGRIEIIKDRFHNGYYSIHYFSDGFEEVLDYFKTKKQAEDFVNKYKQGKAKSIIDRVTDNMKSSGKPKAKAPLYPTKLPKLSISYIRKNILDKDLWSDLHTNKAKSNLEFAIRHHFDNYGSNITEQIMKDFKITDDVLNQLRKTYRSY